MGRKPSVRILNTDVALVPVGELTEHPKNPRIGDVGAIRASVKTNGFFGVVVAQKSTGHVLAGNHRFRAAVEEGLVSIPVAWVDVDDAAAEKILAADNRTSDLGEYDNAQLASLLQSVADASGLDGTGYSDDDLTELLDKLSGEEREPGGSNGGGYESRPLVTVVCRDEDDQQETYEKLKAQGYDCRMSVE